MRDAIAELVEDRVSGEAGWRGGDLSTSYGRCVGDHVELEVVNEQMEDLSDKDVHETSGRESGS